MFLMIRFSSSQYIIWIGTPFTISSPPSPQNLPHPPFHPGHHAVSIQITFLDMRLVGQAADFINGQAHEWGWGMDAAFVHVQVLDLEKQTVKPFGHLGIKVGNKNIILTLKTLFHTLNVCPEIRVSLAE
jgi:hypothetical protein